MTANITAYRYGPSDWATLGKLFVDYGPNADAIAAEIANMLNEGKHAVR